MNRRAIILRRVLMLVPTMLAIYTITFVLMHATPGGPWSGRIDELFETWDVAASPGASIAVQLGHRCAFIAQQG